MLQAYTDVLLAATPILCPSS